MPDVDSRLNLGEDQVPRHPELIRLTGRHPFNVEPPLTLLMDAGLITPPAIHIVRDHGAVPKINWEDHRLDISGAVNNPITLTMDEIVAMETISFPCTVTCAGQSICIPHAYEMTRALPSNNTATHPSSSLHCSSPDAYHTSLQPSPQTQTAAQR
jgi:hypothetical protein